jgi:hypothetical protein
LRDAAGTHLWSGAPQIALGTRLWHAIGHSGHSGRRMPQFAFGWLRLFGSLGAPLSRSKTQAEPYLVGGGSGTPPSRPPSPPQNASAGLRPTFPPALHLRVRTPPPASALPSLPPSISASERLRRPPPYLPIPARVLLPWYLSPAHLILCIFRGRFRRCTRASATTSRAPATFVRAGLCLRSPRSAVPDHLLFHVPIKCVLFCSACEFLV